MLDTPYLLFKILESRPICLLSSSTPHMPTILVDPSSSSLFILLSGHSTSVYNSGHNLHLIFLLKFCSHLLVFILNQLFK